MLLGTELYRSLWREAGKLVDEHAVSHFRAKIRTTFHQTPVPESSTAAVKRTKAAQKLLRQLQAANDGYFHALTRVLETTYGRRGPSKHALLQPFLPLPPPNQPRPTTFPPALCSLLSSPISHSTRPQTPSQLLKPPTLPERVDPKSEEARLIGPLTLQREKAIRKRYFRDQVAKIRAPIGVRIDGLGEGEVAEKEVLENAGVVGWKVGNTLLEILEEKLSGEGGPRATIPRRLLDRLEPKPTSTTGTNSTTTAATTSPSTPEKPKLSRTEKKLLVPRILSPSSKNTKWDLPKTVTSRLLRRIYQRILADSPVVSISIPSPTTPPKSPATFPNLKPRIAIVRSRFAKGGQAGIAVLSEEEAWWAEQGMGADENRRGQGRKGPSKPGK